jgi:hypothetical protein
VDRHEDRQSNHTAAGSPVRSRAGISEAHRRPSRLLSSPKKTPEEFMGRAAARRSAQEDSPRAGDWTSLLLIRPGPREAS